METHAQDPAAVKKLLDNLQVCLSLSLSLTLQAVPQHLPAVRPEEHLPGDPEEAAGSEGVCRGGHREDQERQLSEHTPGLPQQPDPLPPCAGDYPPSLPLLYLFCAGLRD